jgi:hypothetical protein
MAILNPEHLLEQAEKLVAPPAAGPPRQVDLRRAISTAYYGLFHFMLTAVADEFVGVTQRASSRYTLVYRSIDHRGLKDLCSEIRKRTPSSKYAAYLPVGGFDQNVQIFAASAVDLQEKRHNADYNPQHRYTTFDAKLAIETARNAIQSFQQADGERRRAFVTLLLCPPRA